VVRELILAAIREVCFYAKENEAEFVAKLREDSQIQQADTAKVHRKQLAKHERRIAELDRLFIRIYEDNTNNKLSDDRFNQMSAAYDREQAELKAQNAGITAELAAFEQDNLKADRFLELVRKYTSFDELSKGMILEFVDKVVVHEADKSTGERIQQFDIYLNFIGNFKAPKEEIPLTPEEIAKKAAYRAERNRKNENLRIWRSKRKSEKLATKK
jgi:hypothetical protein